MLTYDTYPDTYRGNRFDPVAVKLILCEDHPSMTFAGDCSHADNPAQNTIIRYGVIGTMYGYLHGSAGGWRLWKSASGAFRAAKSIRDDYEWSLIHNHAWIN